MTIARLAYTPKLAVLAIARLVNPPRLTAPLLTFDDGPSESTEEVLDLLREYGVRADFFVIGSRVQQRPDLVERAAAEGHTIGNHTWDHVRLAQLPDEDVLLELNQTNEVVEEIIGEPPELFRAPWLDIDDRVIRLAASLGLTHVGIDIDTCDYSPKSEHSAEYVAASILGATTEEVVLLHDGTGNQQAGPTNPPRPKTVEALRQALPVFAARWSGTPSLRAAKSS